MTRLYKKKQLNNHFNRQHKALRRVALPLMLGLSLVILSGCNQASRRWFGFERTPPDETLIITKPALIVPPDFTLRPPSAKDGSDDAASKAGKTAADTRDLLLKGSKKTDGSAQDGKTGDGKTGDGKAGGGKTTP